MDERGTGSNIGIASPREASERGSQVSLRCPYAEKLVIHMADRGVTVDFRPPDIVRLGITPLYTRYVDIWDAVEVLLESASELRGQGAGES